MVKSGKQARRAGTLADSPSHLMHRVLQLALDIYAEEAGTNGPTQRQFAVLEAVSVKSGLTQTDLVARMTTKGLLARERSSLDARAMAVSLSAEGQALLDAARPRVEAADKRIMGLLPKAKRDGFLELLSELAASADAAPEQAKAEMKALKKAQKEARKAEKAARKAAEPAKKARKPKKAKAVEPVV